MARTRRALSNWKNKKEAKLLVKSTHQVLCHLHGDGRDLLAVLADHFLDDIGEVVVLRLPDDVQEGLHHRPDKGGDVFFGCKRGEKESVLKTH